MFDRPGSERDKTEQGGAERAVLVHLGISSQTGRQSRQRLDSPLGREAIDEFRELVISAGALPVATITSTRRKPDSRLLVGKGKAEEILEAIAREKADLVLIDHPLAPSQERNLESFLECRVQDRTGLILDIFAQRASSHEGRLQVELAQLKHISTRLVRGWTHLERQKGGIGLRGPGETQLETDRRLLALRIKQLNKRLDKVKNQRKQSRQARCKAEVPTISLVGYTNAGKSTLFNQLTESAVYVADKLFATLDPTLRRVELPDAGDIILADTVGFIRNLPHDLVAAFRSTLDETREAEVLLHIIDVSNPNYQEQMDQVNIVLKEIGADNVPQILVFNKVDLLQEHQVRVDRDEQGQVNRVWLSAATGEGTDGLLEALNERFSASQVRERILVPASNGRLRAKLYHLGTVIKESIEENGDVLLDIEIPRRDLENLQKTESVQFSSEDRT